MSSGQLESYREIHAYMWESRETVTNLSGSIQAAPGKCGCLHSHIVTKLIENDVFALQAIAEQAQKAQPAAKPSLAAHLQAANLERFLSDEHPPIRRVKMVGLKAGLLVS